MQHQLAWPFFIPSASSTLRSAAVRAAFGVGHGDQSLRRILGLSSGSMDSDPSTGRASAWGVGSSRVTCANRRKAERPNKGGLASDVIGGPLFLLGKKRLGSAP